MFNAMYLKFFNLLYQYAATVYLFLFAWWVPDSWQEGDLVIGWLGLAAATPMVAAAALIYWLS